MKKLVAVLIVLFMIMSCFAVGMTIADEPGRTEKSVQKRAGDEKKNVESVTGELAYMEDFRWDMPDRTQKYARNRTGDEKAEALLVEGLSDTEDLHKAGGKTGIQKGRRSDEEADSDVEGLSVTGVFTDDFTRDFRGGDFRRASTRLASVVVGDPITGPLQPLRCSSDPFDAVGDIFVNQTGWWEDGGAFNPSSDTPLQDAIDFASGGDTIFVYNGTYNESLTIDKSLTLIGEHRDTTFIDGMGSNCITVTDVTPVNVEIKGFSIHNGSAGIYVESDEVTITVSDNNISANAYGGVQVNATSSIDDASITCNIIADNGCDCGDVFTGGGIRLYVNESTGTINATIRDNNIEYNRCGGIRIGWWGASLGPFGNASGPFAGLQRVCGTITALIDNNTISNNRDGSIRIKSRDTLTANVTNNYIGNINETRAGGLVRLGWVSQYEDTPTEDYEYPTAFVTANVSNNIIECGNDSNNVSTGGIIRIVANDTINATVHENVMHGGHAIGGVMRIGRGCFTKNVTANVTNNTLDFADVLGYLEGDSTGGVGGFVRMDASDMIDAEVNENNITGAQDCNSGVIRIGFCGDDDIAPENITAEVIGNLMNFGNSRGIAGVIRIKANDTINATIEDNTIICGNPYSETDGSNGTGIAGVIRIGRRDNLNATTKQVTATVINNTIDCSNATGIGGFIRIVANDSINATIEKNTITGGIGGVGGVIRIGHGDSSYNTDLSSTANVTAKVINNTMDCNNSGGIAGFIRIKASDTLDATIKANNFTGGRGIVGGVMHLGHNDPAPAEKVTVTVTGNNMDCSNSDGIAGFIKIKASDTLDATITENHFIGNNDSGIGGVIRLGNRDDDNTSTKKVTATLMDNIMDCANSKGIAGFIRIRAKDTLNATINENTIIGGTGGVGGVIRLGHGAPFTRNVTATVNNNEINLTRVGLDCDYEEAGVGGVIRIKGSDSINANITGNNIYGNTTPFSGGGIRIGYDCDQDSCEEVTAVINDNYLAPCKGGGIRLFANDTLNATVKNNIVSGNNGSGIRIGYFCWGESDDITPTVKATVINNTVTDNDGSGIHVSAQDNLTAIIEGNTIADNTYCDNPNSTYVASGSGLYVEGESDVIINFNNIYGNSEFGVLNRNSTETIDARYNWWGSSDGPHASPGSGDNVSANVTYEPWLGAPLVLPAVLHETLAAGADQEIDASAEADTKVIINTTGETVIWVSKYTSQPFPEEPFPDATLGKYVDIRVSDPENVTWPVYVELSYTDAEVTAAGVIEETLGLYYYKPGNTFHRCSDTGVNVTENYIWAFVNETEAGYLAGQEFGAGGDPARKLPILSPLGLLALIGLLSVIAAISIIRTKEREGN